MPNSATALVARSLRVLLAVALLACWQNALVHPVSHVDEAGELIHLSDGHGGDRHDGEGHDPQCDAVAAVAACVSGAAGLQFAALRGTSAPLESRAATARAAVFHAYRSQAPPQHS